MKSYLLFPRGRRFAAAAGENVEEQAKLLLKMLYEEMSVEFEEDRETPIFLPDEYREDIIWMLKKIEWLNEGWEIFHRSGKDDQPEIQRVNTVFNSDEEAIDYVANIAISEPDGFHAHAIRYTITRNDEYRNVIREIVGSYRYKKIILTN